jgi:hypothetical protein
MDSLALQLHPAWVVTLTLWVAGAWELKAEDTGDNP